MQVDLTEDEMQAIRKLAEDALPPATGLPEKPKATVPLTNHRRRTAEETTAYHGGCDVYCTDCDERFTLRLPLTPEEKGPLPSTAPRHVLNSILDKLVRDVRSAA